MVLTACQAAKAPLPPPLNLRITANSETVAVIAVWAYEEGFTVDAPQFNASGATIEIGPVPGQVAKLFAALINKVRGVTSALPVPCRLVGGSDVNYCQSRL